MTGELRFTSGGDFAEDLDIGDQRAEPGTVMVIGSSGELRPSDSPYDSRVAGVAAGAGDLAPAIILGREESPPSRRQPISLIGTVYCKVDARYGRVQAGDLLTTSPRTGHAMVARDRHKAVGAVLGKALRGLESGQAEILILLTLQ